MTMTSLKFLKPPVPELKKIKTNEDCSQVYCDIEATSLHKTCDITQIAVVSGDYFKQYILPTQPITPGVRQVTGLAVINNILCYKGKPVNSVSLKTALEQFLVWLKIGKPCLLIVDTSVDKYIFEKKANINLITLRSMQPEKSSVNKLH
ncbi:hypothetical protein ACF0H5_019466 [Mactra antiquata]